MATPLLKLPEIQENQSGKYITHNEALALIEGVITRVMSRTNNGPPDTPSNGDTYIVDDNSGDWSEFSVNDVAFYYAGKWHNITPIEGLSIWCVNETGHIYYDGSSWQFHQNEFNTTEEYYIGTVSGESFDIDWGMSSYQAMRLESSPTITFSNMTEGWKQLRFKQDVSGERVPDLPNGFWENGVSGEFSTNSGEEDILKIFYNGENYYYQIANFPNM